MGFDIWKEPRFSSLIVTSIQRTAGQHLLLNCGKVLRYNYFIFSVRSDIIFWSGSCLSFSQSSLQVARTACMPISTRRPYHERRPTTSKRLKIWQWESREVKEILHQIRTLCKTTLISKPLPVYILFDYFFSARANPFATRWKPSILARKIVVLWLIVLTTHPPSRYRDQNTKTGR